MRVRVLLLVVVGAVLFSPRASGRVLEDDVKKKQAQLEKLKKEIDQYEGRIKEREKKEHATLDLLDTYDRQATLLRRLIGKLHDQEDELQTNIDQTRRSIGELGGQLSFLKRHYANYVSTVYKNGPMYDLELLLSSKSINQAYIRSEYLKRFSEQRKQDMDKIDSKKTDLESQNTILQNQLAEQKQILSDKLREEQTLASKMKKRKTLLADIRRDKKSFTHEIDRRRQAAKDLEQLIAKLIEEDRARKEKERAAGRTKEEPAPSRETARGGNFQSKRGKLPWPVSQGKIVGRFGNQQNVQLHTITQNTGIDISVPVGSEVNAVADGEVSKIYWLPSFGNLVILNHRNGYRTVYAHLADISVAEGDRIGEGKRIGSSGESLSGAMLHFEIYKDREKQDPEQWLRPRGLVQR